MAKYTGELERRRPSTTPLSKDPGADALERRRQNLLLKQTGRGPLPEFEAARRRTRAQTGALSRQAQLELQRERARTGFGSGAGIRLGQEVQQRLQEQESEKFADIRAQESEAIRKEELAREAQQLQGLEAERTRQFQKQLFDVEQAFKQQVFELDETSKLGVLELERQKQSFDEMTAGFNKIISALSLPAGDERNRLLGDMYNDPKLPSNLKPGLGIYVQATNAMYIKNKLGIPLQMPLPAGIENSQFAAGTTIDQLNQLVAQYQSQAQQPTYYNISGTSETTDEGPYEV